MRAGGALALCAIAGVLVWSHVAIAALSVCLNETPGLFAQLRETLPISASSASILLPRFGQQPGDAQACDGAAPARAMAVAGLAYLVGIILLQRAAIPSRLQWVVIGVAAVAIQFGLFFMPGLLSSDILDYASHGRVAGVHAANPYLVAPAAFPSDPFSAQGAWPNVVTVYGPLWTDIDAAITGFFASGSMVQLALAYKVVGLASHLVIASLIWWIAGRWRALGVSAAARPVAVAMWLWNPVVNVEVVGSAHNEGVMTVLVLLAFALLTLAAQPFSHKAGMLPASGRPTLAPPASHAGRLAFLSSVWKRNGHGVLWLAAAMCLGLGALVKFVPAGIGAIVAFVWLRRAESAAQRVRRALILAAVLGVMSLVVAWPWLDSPAVAGPLVSLAAGGQRFKDPWQDAPAAWLTVRVVPNLDVPDDPPTLRMDVARTMVWGVTRTLFVAYILLEAWSLWRSPATVTSGKLADGDFVRREDTAEGYEAVVLRRITVASVRVLLMAILLFVSQVYAWYFLWPLPMACLLGLREPWSRAAVVFGLTFLPAFYLREFLPYGVFYLPMYGLVALAILAPIWAWGHLPVRGIQR